MIYYVETHNLTTKIQPDIYIKLNIGLEIKHAQHDEQ